VLQDLRLGFDVTLRPAHVYSKPVSDEFHYVRSQARDIRLDFASMTFDLLP